MQPIQHGPGAYRSTQGCVRCGKTIDTTRAAFTGDGMICTECEAHETLREGQAAAASNSGGLGALGWGFISLFCNMLFIPSILAWVNGIKDLKATGHPETAQMLGPEASTIRTKAIFGIILGSLHPLMIVGVVGLAIVSAAIGPSYDPYYDDPYYDPYGYDSVGYDPYDYGSYGNTYDDPYADPYDDPYADPALQQEQIDELIRALEEAERQQGTYDPNDPGSTY